MKRCRKTEEPEALTDYRKVCPASTWDEMRDDPLHGGIQTAKDVKATLVKSQRCLCAFCETKIASNCSEEGILRDNYQQRVEHFHPKDDEACGLNWHLHWPNLLAVCLGGSNQSEKEKATGIHPLPDNLSCDAFKDHQITIGKLPDNPEGWILSPEDVPAFPLIFQFSPTGQPEPHPDNCDSISFLPNQYRSYRELVEKTIEHLNLGCFRLAERRRITRARLEKRIENVRLQSAGASPKDVMLRLAREIFTADPTTPWPEFFTLVRWRLGDAAEEHLSSIQYDG